MASGTQQHQYQQQHPQQSQQQQQHHHHHQQQELPMPQQQANHMQFVSNQDACYDPYQQMQQLNTMSPIASTPMSVDQSRGHMGVPMNSHQPQSNTIINSVMSTNSINQEMCNQPATQQQHIMQPQQQQQQQQKSQLLPLLLSPIPTSVETPDHSDQPESDHDQIIDQVISLENDYSDPSGTMTNVDNLGMATSHQGPQNLPMSDRPNPSGAQAATAENNQLSNSSEDDLLNLLLEMDRDSANMSGGNHQLDQDEKMGIENIRKQLMGCDVQSDQLVYQNANSMSPVINQYGSSHISHQVGATSHQQPQHLAHHNIQASPPQPQQQQQQQQNQQPQQQVNQHQLVSQTAPVIPPHQQQAQHQISTSSLSQRQQQLPQHHHRLSVDQTLLHGPYSNAHAGAVPVTSAGHSYTPPQQQQQQQHQNIARISQSTPMSVDDNSPSPSWPQPQLSPFSPPNQHNDPTRPPSQHRQHPVMQQHPTTTSPQIQQLHHPLQRRSPSQSISPPATTEPSPVVKKNPLLNAQLINTRAPSITPSRFMNNQMNVLNQNPILNSKLSQGSYIANNCGTIGGQPVSQGMQNQQPRFTQDPGHQQQQSGFNYDMNQQQQQQNAQLHTTPQPGYISMYGPGSHQRQQQQQSSNQMFRGSPVSTAAPTSVQQGGVPHMVMGSTSPCGGLSPQVKQEIRKKVQQPRQQQQQQQQHQQQQHQQQQQQQQQPHQTTSLLKQLLSDDNK